MVHWDKPIIETHTPPLLQIGLPEFSVATFKVCNCGNKASPCITPQTREARARDGRTGIRVHASALSPIAVGGPKPRTQLAPAPPPPSVRATPCLRREYADATSGSSRSSNLLLGRWRGGREKKKRDVGNREERRNGADSTFDLALGDKEGDRGNEREVGLTSPLTTIPPPSEPQYEESRE